MRQLRLAMLTIVAIPLFGVVVTHADDAGMGPLEIVADCLEAAQQRDLGRYVDHLSSEEQKVQAGYVLLITSLYAQSTDLGGGTEDPEFYLLVRALKDIVRQHSIPKGEWDQEQQAAEETRRKMTSQLWSAIFGQPTVYGHGLPTPSLGVRQCCLKSTDVLKDTRQFLIAVLTEASRPTLVSGAEPAQPASSTMCVDLVKAYAALKWTLYTRGDYALAVASEPTPYQAPPAQCTDSGCVAVYPPVSAPQVNIEFRRIDGQWKIDRLLPASALLSVESGVPVEPHGPTFDPYATTFPTPGVAPAPAPPLPPNYKVSPPATAVPLPR